MAKIVTGAAKRSPIKKNHPLKAKTGRLAWPV